MNAKQLYDWGKRYIKIPLIGVVCFLVYLYAFNENSVFDSMSYERDINDLKAKIKDNEDSLNYYRDLNARLETDCENLERVGRENYHMQRQNEDIYVFE